MNPLIVPGAVLDYQVLDLTPPWAQPPATVLFHHGIGTDAGIWSEWLPLLAGRFRLVCFSMRGCGANAAPGELDGCSLDRLSDDLLALADAVGAERFHIVAESFGGTVAMNAALRAPQRVQSLMLLSTPHRGAAVTPVANWPGYTESPEGMARWSDEMMAGRFRPGAVSGPALDWFRRTQERTPAPVLRHLAGLVAAADLTAALPQLEVPALLIAGDSSPYVGLGQLAALRQLLPHARVQVIPNAGHGIAFSHARVCARSLLDFVAGAAGLSFLPEEIL